MNRWLLVLITLILGITLLTFAVVSSGPKDTVACFMLGLIFGCSLTLLEFKEFASSVVIDQKPETKEADQGRPPAPCKDDCVHYEWVNDGWPCPFCAAIADSRNQDAREYRLAKRIARHLK